MFKKLVYIVIAFILPFAQTGILAHVHLCDNNITAISFSEHENDPCACEGFGSTDCCSDLVVKSKIDIDANHLVQLKIKQLPKILLKAFVVEPKTCATEHINKRVFNRSKWRCCLSVTDKIIESTCLRN